MSPVAAIIQSWPYVVAFLVALAMPIRKNNWERISLGLIAVLSLAFVRTLWPTAVVAEAEPSEWPHLLNVILLLPLLGAAAVLFLPRQAPVLLQRFTLAVLALDLLASLFLLSANYNVAGWHFQYVADWVPALGIRYHVAVDGLSLWMVLLSTFSMPIAAYVSFGSIKKRTKELCFALLLLHAGMLGAFVSLDLFLFYVFWELMLVPMIVLIGVWGGVEKIKASYKFFLYTMAGSVLMLGAILYLVWAHTQLEGYPTFDYLALSRLALPQTAAWLCFGGFALAFLVKVPMWPFHTWLPDAHVQAPTGGSIILAAVLLKLGTYGYLRFCMGMFGGPAAVSAATLSGFAVAGGIIYAALVAWKQDDIKRLVAYSSVAHMGFVMLGLFTGTQAGIEGALIQCVNHGVATGALFLLVGVIYDRRHTRLVREFGGLAKVMPVYATLFVIVTMASVGVPGTNGFVGEFMITLSTFVSRDLGQWSHISGTGAAFGVILAAVYMLTMVQKVFFGPLDNPKNQGLPDMTVRETLAIAPLIVAIFVIGFFPNILLSRMHESVRASIHKYQEGRRAYMESRPNEAALIPRDNGPWERGYPEAPKEKSERQAMGTPTH